MSGRTKIFVFHMKELIYTGIFAVLAIILVVLLVVMFGPGNNRNNATETATVTYAPGVYSSSLDFQGQAMAVQVTVDDNYIRSVSFVNLDESIATMYPLMETSLDSIEEQVCATQSTENITYPAESQYTTQMLLEAVKTALSKAEVQPD